MSSTIAAADLTRRDDGSSSDGRTVAFEILISIMILFAASILIIPPIVFLSPSFGWRWRSYRDPDLEHNNNNSHHQHQQPRRIVVHRTRDADGLVHIDIIDLPPPPEETPHATPGYDDEHQPQQHQPSRFATKAALVKTRLATLGCTVGTTLAAQSAAVCASLRRGLTELKPAASRHNHTVVDFRPGDSPRHARARRQRARGLSIDLPVMKEPAWQRLASGGLSPATTLGDFIRQAQEDASATPMTRSPETDVYRSSSTARQQQQQQQQQTEADEVMETEKAQEENMATAVTRETSREIHRDEVDPQGHGQSHGHDQVHIQVPEPVATWGMGIAH